MAGLLLTRRRFGTALAQFMTLRALHAQSPSVAHADVAAMERTRILTEAGAAKETAPKSPSDLSTTIATLTAAFLLTKEPAYAEQAGQLLEILTQKISTPATTEITTLVPVAEAAVAYRFLVDALSQEAIKRLNAWLSNLQNFLNEDHAMLLARDTRDHRASAWLFVTAAIARSQHDEATLEACRHRFKKPTLRNQVDAQGAFPHEVATDFPYRNTLFNFDLLAGACQLLSTPFDNLWLYELEDGPGMRAVAAFLYPMIKDKGKWTYIADPQNFRDLPGRRPGLLFAGRAYDRPEYVALWRDTPAPDLSALPGPIAASFPIHEPLLWTARAAHGL